MFKAGGFVKEEVGQRLFMEGNNCFSSTSSNCPPCVYLYNWSLLRVSGGHCKNSIARNGVQIALEGSRTSDLLDCDKFRTAPIESRIEMCKLRTITGMRILLRGPIDEQRTHENGFSFQVIKLFLTGFPFIWNHVINECCSQPSLNGSVLPASKENHPQKEKDEGPNSHLSGIYTGEGVSIISISLNAEEKKDEGNESTSKIISREALVRGCSRGRYGSPVLSSKRIKRYESSINHKPTVLSPSVELPENPNILKEFVSNLSMGTPTAPVDKKDMAPKQMHSCKETYENFDTGDHLIESGSKLLREKPSKVVVSQEDKYFVERKKAVEYNVIRSMKEMRESRKQFYSEISFDEAELTQLMCPVKEDGNENQTNSHFDCSGDSDHQIIDVNETEESPAENVHLDQMKSNCTSPGQQMEEMHKSVSEFSGTGCKTGRLISSDKSQTKRNRLTKCSQASRNELWGEITDETVTGLSNVACHEDITSAGEECKNYSLFPSDPDFGLISDEITRNIEDVKEQIEKNCLADVPDFEFLCIEKNISSASVGNKPTPLPGIHLTNDVNKSVKQKKNLSTEKRGRSKTRTRHIDQSPKLFEIFISNQNTVNGDGTVKCNDMDATCDANPHQVASEIEHCISSKNCTETGNTCQQGNGDGKEGSMQIPKTSTGINVQTQPNKRQLPNNIPPPPPCCKHATFEELSTENGKQLYFRRTRSAKCSDVDLGQMKNKSISGGQETQVQKLVSEFLGTGYKPGKLISLDKSQTNRNRNNKSSQASRGELNREIRDETVKKLSNVTSSDKITSTGDECESYNLSPSDPEFGLSCNEINSPGEDGKGQIQIQIQVELETLADVDKFEFISSSSEENKPISLTENHPNNDVNTVKQLNNSNTKKGRSSKTYQQRNGNGEKGCKQTQETSTRINVQTQTNKKQLSNNILPTPCSRVHTTPEEVSKAFGLKTSKSGRLLVPPLAHWCNQAIAYDVDGGIIAILDASSQRDGHSGRLFFTPPKEKDAIRMQKKLRNAANETSSRSKIRKK